MQMRFDIEYLKKSNMIRKHIKVEPRCYYAHCDRIGMMLGRICRALAEGHFGANWLQLVEDEWPQITMSSSKELKSMVEVFEIIPQS